MKPEIKTRLVLIQAGKTPEGYKKTKAGIIPQNWEIKKLSDVLKKQTQKNTNNEIQNVLTNSATQGIVCQTDYFDKQIANNENTAGYYIVKPGYFVYNPRISVSAPCGPFNRYNGNEDGIMSPLYSVYCFCDKSLMYADFLTYYFSSSKWYAYMNSIANYGVRSDRMNITNEDMDNMPIPYPPLAEQEKIVAILTAQDKVIELCERKIEQLKRMKKYYLQNMFPKGGEEYPEIRFKGFTDAWEQRKLGDISDSYSGGTPTAGNSEYYGGAIPFIRSAEVNSDSTELFLTEEGLKNSSAKMVNKGDILYALYGATSGEVGLAQLNGAINQAILDIKPHANYDAQFIMQWLRKSKENIISTYLQGGQGNLSGTIVTSLIVDCPTYSEQQKIGDYFRNLDTLITLHQRKCEEEKKKKKALQQLLLTGLVRV